MDLCEGFEKFDQAISVTDEEPHHAAPGVLTTFEHVIRNGIQLMDYADIDAKGTGLKPVNTAVERSC